MPCSSGFVCVQRKNPEYTGPLCVPAGSWTCKNVTCDSDYHCCDQEIPSMCAEPPCYPIPVCVANWFTGDIESNLPPLDQHASYDGSTSPGSSPNPGTTEENPSSPQGSQVPLLPPPPPSSPPSGAGSPGFTDATNPPGEPPGHNATFGTCGDANPCFIGFKCVILPSGHAGCKKVVTCSDIHCPKGQRCIAVPLTQDAYCAKQEDCTQTGCNGNQICVNDNINTPYCRKPLTCNDISCATINNCRSGDNDTDAVCVAACPATETWDRCGGCESSCDNQNKVCDAACHQKEATCVCNSGLVRGPDGSCINPSECPGPAPPGSSPVTPASGVDLYNRCEALNCPSGQYCIVNGSDMSCGSSGEVECKCTQEQICVLQVAPKCNSSPCVLLPTCVNFPVINPPASNPPASNPPASNPPSSNPPSSSTGPYGETEPPASQPPADMPKADPCASMDCGRQQCMEMPDGSAQCVDNNPPMLPPPFETSSGPY